MVVIENVRVRGVNVACKEWGARVACEGVKR